jgi:hypothetical protein
MQQPTRQQLKRPSQPPKYWAKQTIAGTLLQGVYFWDSCDHDRYRTWSER